MTKDTKNMTLHNAIMRKGYGSIQNFCRYSGLNYAELRGYLNNTKSPFDQMGLIREDALTICDYTGLDACDLHNQSHQEVIDEKVYTYTVLPESPELVEYAYNKELIAYFWNLVSWKDRVQAGRYRSELLHTVKNYLYGEDTVTGYYRDLDYLCFIHYAIYGDTFQEIASRFEVMPQQAQRDSSRARRQIRDFLNQCNSGNQELIEAIKPRMIRERVEEQKLIEKTADEPTVVTHKEPARPRVYVEDTVGMKKMLDDIKKCLTKATKKKAKANEGFAVFGYCQKPYLKVRLFQSV